MNSDKNKKKEKINQESLEHFKNREDLEMTS